MKNFAKSILNYFAAFNETRFRFSRKLPYEWSDDPLTLDLSVFPVFQKKLLDSVAQGIPFRVEVEKGEYIVTLDSNVIRESLLKTIESKFNQEFVNKCIEDCKERIKEAFPEIEGSDLDVRALAEGLREYNLVFRGQILDTLIEIQEKKIRDLQAELKFSSVPPSSFNPQREVQKIYDDLKELARNETNQAGYVSLVTKLIQEQAFQFVMFDLHPVLRRYIQLISAQSIYVFFQEIAKEEHKYPIFSIELEINDGDRSVVIQSIRDVIMVNTPAINNFEFDTVLTTPRACRFEDGVSAISTMESFLQAKFNVTEKFLLKAHYPPLIREGLPTIRYRIGLQAVKEEDRRILDYSELITSLGKGAGNKFIDMISKYVAGNVKSTIDEVQNKYSEYYLRKSAERLVPARLTIPLSLNETQRKILTAVENEKNQIIVVDGPPGTGKSYTITAIVYLANQLGKSVVITSHKKQALDVIDEFLTEQFKKLHPRSKPSILRLERSRGPSSLNNITNTLSSPVINAARTRFHQFNREAVENDRKRLFKDIESANNMFWDTSERYDDLIQKTFDWIQAGEAIFATCSDRSDILPPRLPQGIHLDIDRIQKLTSLLSESPATISLQALRAIFSDQERLPEILSKIDKLNETESLIPSDDLKNIETVPPELNGFKDIVEKISQCLESNVPLSNVDTDRLDLEPPEALNSIPFKSYDMVREARDKLSHLVSIERQFLGKIRKNKEFRQIREALETDHSDIKELIERDGYSRLHNLSEEMVGYVEESHNKHPFLLKEYIFKDFRKCSPKELQSLIKKLESLKFHPVVNLLTQLTGKSLFQMTLAEIKEKVELLHLIDQYMALRNAIETFARHVGMSMEDLPQLYTVLKKVQEFIGALQKEDITELEKLFKYYGALLQTLAIDSSDLSSLGKLTEDGNRAEHVFRFIRLHSELSAFPIVTPPSKTYLEEYLNKSHKLLEYQTDNRMSDFLNHAADVQRIQTAIDAGKRILPEQAHILFKNLACIISEPRLISQHFPMEADMIDFLVIDEASQVSIAESISLMLRAKQTIVFGDELQYGAVGAVNVSQRYSTYYFKDILKDYAQDRNQAISEEETERIAREVSETPTEEEEESSHLFPVDPATREWLKTFSVRTSTLAFAKALCNYSDSLNVHFRSFPEIISYSNEFFYKESQIELMPTRIRTKPIGEVLRFIQVETKGLSGRNVNLDEIEAIQSDLEEIIGNGYKGTIGVVCSFREQAARMEELFRKELDIYPELMRNHRFSIWFVGDVQGEERDLVYYSFVQDKKLDNADLKTIYPIIGGTADNIRRLKMQRLNVGFSRAKDSMVFVHSMPISEYSDTRLGDALRYYQKIFNTAHDHYIEDESVFESPAEKELYTQILQTPFFQENHDRLRLIAQFEIGKYIREEYHRNIPKYRTDFLLTLSEGGKERSLIIEYDGLEFHTQNPDLVTKHNFDQEYLEYDVARQLELESYGYSFLRINKFSLLPQGDYKTPVEVLNHLLESCLLS